MRRPEEEVRRGPWTGEEDALLTHYVTRNGEGHWNSLAYHAGLKRTGKSCRLRWLNYLKPDIKRGNLTQQEHLLIFELHSKLGNRWSKIAQHLPGRTDNEIKNYWRTRVQKQVRQLINIHQSNTTDQFVDSSSSSNSTRSHSDSSVCRNLSPPNPSLSISNSPKKAQPISVHPKGCLNSLKDQNFLAEDSILSFVPDHFDESPDPNNISQFYDFDRSSNDYHVITSDNIPVHGFETCSADYVEMKSVEQFTEFQASFDMSEFDYELASGDWTCDSFWKF